jgi:hypothetical protein
MYILAPLFPCHTIIYQRMGVFGCNEKSLWHANIRLCLEFKKLDFFRIPCNHIYHRINFL